MPTTADYLTDLTNQRDALAENLTAMGVVASDIEKFGTLVPKVLNINTYKTGVYTPANDTESFSVSGLSEAPERFIIYTLKNPKNATVENEYQIAIVAYDLGWDATDATMSGFIKSVTLPVMIMNFTLTYTQRYSSYNNGVFAIDFSPRVNDYIFFSGGTTYKWVMW